MSEVDDDGDVLSAFMQLRHVHEKLQDEKKAIEQYFQEILEDTQAKDEEIARLRQRNASLAETSRELQKSKLGAEEELEQIAKQLDSGAAGRRQPRQRGRLGSTDDGLARRDGARTPTASLEDEDEETASLPLSADLDQAELRRRLAAVERLVERYRQRLFSKEQLFLSMQDLLDEKDEASAALKKRLAATYAGYVSPVAAEAATPLGIQLAELKAQMEESQSLLHQREAEIARLRDLVDELEGHVDASRQEARRLSMQVEESQLNISGVSLADEMEATLNFKGMHIDEQKRMFQEKLDLVERNDDLMDQLRLAQNKFGMSQRKYVASMTSFRERDKILINLLSKNRMSSRRRKELVELLKSTTPEI